MPSGRTIVKGHKVYHNSHNGFRATARPNRFAIATLRDNLDRAAVSGYISPTLANLIEPGPDVPCLVDSWYNKSTTLHLLPAARPGFE